MQLDIARRRMHQSASNRRRAIRLRSILLRIARAAQTFSAPLRFGAGQINATAMAVLPAFEAVA